MPPYLLLLLPLATATVIGLGLKRQGQLSALAATASALVCLVISCMLLFGKAPDANTTLFSWVKMGDFQLTIGTKIDALSKSMMFVVTFIGFLVHVFSLGYMKDEPGKGRFFGGLSLFMFSMTGIVLAPNLPMMFIFWELVGVSSYILIGHWYDKNSAADAAKKAFLTNRIGDFGFMIGILLIWSLTGGITDFDQLKEWFVAHPGQSTGLMVAITLCIFCGTVGKSAQFPLHVWLPDAMEGPTPVSALIHAATMVAAGVYLMVRCSFLVLASPDAAMVISYIGGVTALMAALMATQQNDIKRVLAFSTLSQLGYMVMAVGLLKGEEAGYFHLFTHAFFKAMLFLGSGAVIHACHHEQDIWKMGGLSSKMKLTTLTFAIGTAALIAVPFTSGFFSKEEILAAALEKNKVLFGLAAFTALLTAFYMTRMFVVAFLGKPRTENADHAHEVGPIMLLPLLILAVPSVIAGLPFFTSLFGLKIGEHAGHLHMGTPFFASIASLVIGAGLGFALYKGKNEEPLKISLFANKFYFDEIYAWIVKKFQDTTAGILALLDKVFIDGLGVRGSSLGATGLGHLFRKLQMGNIHGYSLLFGIGAVLVLILALGGL
jgi:NADH-quinone oxidoreductase subunit L